MCCFLKQQTSSAPPPPFSPSLRGYKNPQLASNSAKDRGEEILVENKRLTQKFGKEHREKERKCLHQPKSHRLHPSARRSALPSRALPRHQAHPLSTPSRPSPSVRQTSAPFSSRQKLPPASYQSPKTHRKSQTPLPIPPVRLRSQLRGKHRCSIRRCIYSTKRPRRSEARGLKRSGRMESRLGRQGHSMVRAGEPCRIMARMKTRRMRDRDGEKEIESCTWLLCASRPPNTLPQI